jgi:hypothetical protein
MVMKWQVWNRIDHCFDWRTKCHRWLIESLMPRQMRFISSSEAWPID